jgi:hypothetical protein
MSHRAELTKEEHFCINKHLIHQSLELALKLTDLKANLLRAAMSRASSKPRKRDKVSYVEEGICT